MRTRLLPIRYRLPLFVCALVLTIGVIASVAAYLAVRHSALTSASTRVRAVSTRLDELLTGSAQRLVAHLDSIAARPEIVAAALNASPSARGRARGVLDSLAHLSSSVETAELWDRRARRVMERGTEVSPMRPGRADSLAATVDSAGATQIGPLEVVADRVAYSAIAPVRQGSQTVGYLVLRQRATGSERSNQQIRGLIGSAAALLVGNAAGDVWTDLVHPVDGPPVTVPPGKGDVTTYTRRDGSVALAAAARIGYTPWVVLIEFPESAVLSEPHTVALYLASITGVLVLLGGFAGWLLSRGITRPLTDLAVAAREIAGGDYGRRAAAPPGDELGDLAAAFNHMAGTVDQMHRSLEQRVAEQTAELRAVNRELESFSYSVSHDLRAPLRSIDGFSLALLEDYGDVVDEKGRRHLERVRGASQRMGRLIDDLLGLAQMSRGQLQLESLDLSAMAQEIVHELSEQDVHRDANVRIAPGLRAIGDRRLVRVALTNLLHNAWKFTRRQAAPVIEFGRTEHEFFVRDNGVGFDMAYADKLFSPFQRLHSLDDFEGTGIGLATVQRIVHRHGGEIRAEAEEGRGATIWFTVPPPHTGNGNGASR